MDDSRITCVHVIYSLEYGGAQRVLLDYARFLDRGRYRLEVVALAAGGAMTPLFEELGVPVRELGLRASDLRLRGRLRRIFSESSAVIAHLHNPLPVFMGLPAAARVRVPVKVMTEHSIDYKGRTDGPLATALYRRLRRSLDTVIACSEEVARSHAPHIDPERLVVIPNGVDTDLFAPRGASSEERTAAGAGPGDFLIAAVGSLTPQKGFAHLLDAVASLMSRGVPARLAIAGEGPLRAELEAYARGAGCADGVRFLGAIPGVRSLLAAADIFAGSSLREGLPLGVLEAMSCGRPVVTTDVGGNGEAVEDGITGRLVPAGDPEALAGALEDLFNDTAKRVAMGAAGRARAVERFSARRMVERTEELYRRLALAATAK